MVSIDKTAEQSIQFSNLEHLSDLNSDDLLTIRLYQNKDSQNALWEYGFRRDGIGLLSRLKKVLVWPMS
jgi:hypothetical protein